MSTKKEETRQRRVDREKAALRYRIEDFFIGVTSGYVVATTEDGGTLSVASLDQLVNWQRAMHRALPLPTLPENCGFKTTNEARDAAFWYWHLPKFEAIETTVDHLYDYGFRAEE